MEENQGEKEVRIFLREAEDDRFEALINSYIFYDTTKKITERKVEVMVKI